MQPAQGHQDVSRQYCSNFFCFNILNLSYDFDKFIQESFNSPNCWRDVKEKMSQRSGVCGKIYIFYNDLKIKQMHQINFMSNPS